MATAAYRSFMQNLQRRRERGPTSVERMRNDADRFARSVVVSNDVSITLLGCPALSGLQLDPHTRTSTDVIVHFHGGGFVSGSPEQHLALLHPLARACGARTVAPRYRLAPENPCPAAHHDAVGAYRRLLELDVDPANMVVSGDSAGAHLAICTLLTAKREGLPMPRRLVLVCPWIDPTLSSASMGERVASDPVATPETIRLARDSYFVGAAATDFDTIARRDFSAMPPILVHTAGLDPFRDEGAALVRQARLFGVPVVHDHWPEMVHVWHLYAHLFPEATDAIAGIAHFLSDSPRDSDLCNGMVP